MVIANRNGMFGITFARILHAKVETVKNIILFSASSDNSDQIVADESSLLILQSPQS